MNLSKESFKMKSTGIIRKLDDLGRIVIPKELRDNFNLLTKDSLEIFKEQNKIILTKYEPGCKFCSEIDVSLVYKGYKLCKDCFENIKELK